MEKAELIQGIKDGILEYLKYDVSFDYGETEIHYIEEKEFAIGDVYVNVLFDVTGEEKRDYGSYDREPSRSGWRKGEVLKYIVFDDEKVLYSVLNVKGLTITYEY